jgi:soluble lytic murein transglycosylase
MPSVWRFHSTEIAQTLIDEARKYQFDPIFLVAVIQHESKWNPSAKGDVGELGLMQIRPTTAQWLSKRLHLPWGGKLSLYNPEANIRVGAAYLAHLRGNFSSSGRLYLAAYNMGRHAVNQALRQKVVPKDYAAHVMHYYVGIYEELADFAGDLANKGKPATAIAAATPAPVATGITAIANAPQGHAPAAQGTQALPALQIYPAIEQD